MGLVHEGLVCPTDYLEMSATVLMPKFHFMHHQDILLHTVILVTPSFNGIKLTAIKWQIFVDIQVVLIM